MLAASQLAMALAIVSPNTPITPPEIVSVSMFKNGYAFVTRSISLKSGEANIVEVPQASLGTLWFWTQSGELESVSSAEELNKTKADVPFSSLDQVVQKNVGKAVSVDYRFPNGSTSTVTGTIKSATGEILVLDSDKGVMAISKGNIHSLQSTDKTFAWSHTVETPNNTKFYHVKTKGGAKQVMMMSLERGMTWAPGYAIDLSNPTKLTLASKATVLNDLAPLKGVDVRLITGFPNMQFKDILDPFTAGMPMDSWLGTLSTGSAPGGLPRGGGGYGAQMMMQNAAVSMDRDVRWGGANAPDAGGEQIGDLFFYDLDKFELEKGARKYQNLFKFESEYKHIYTWDIEDQVDESGNYRQPTQVKAAEEVWHTIQFVNSSSKPLTTAPATIFNKGEMIGQTMMNFCPASAECDVKINKALEVRAETSEEEVSRERGAIKDQYNNPRWDLVTVKGTLEIKNGRKEAVDMAITKKITGEYISGQGSPSVVKTTKGLRQINPSSKLTWKPSVAKGETLRLEYSYKLYVPSQ
jgi:hypothetical protein